MPDDAVAPSASLIRVSDSAGVRELALNRPRRHNSLIPELLTGLREAIAEARTDGVRCLLLRAEGRSFSTGGDVAGFAARTGAELHGYAQHLVGELNGAILDLLRVPFPVVAAVHGPVTGGSLGLVLASDVSIGGPEAWFQSFYTEVGFSPDGGWTALLPTRVGYAQAMAWQVNNERIGPHEAHAAGLLTHYHADPKARAHELAHEIAGRAPGSITRTKRLLTPDLARVEAALEREREEFIEQILTNEARQGMEEFLARPSAGKEADENS